MDQTIQRLLKKLDLTDNEIKIYLAALKLSEAKITDLAKESSIHRVAAYALVESLIKKGLLITIGSQYGRVISANSPRTIQQLLNDKKRKLRKVELKYQELLPNLLAMYKESGIRPHVKFFEGIKGLEQIHSDIIKTLSELPQEQRITYSYSNPKMIKERFEGYVDDPEGYVAQRKQYKIYNKAIAPDNDVSRDIATRNKEELRELIILPETMFPYKNDITIYGNKMAIESLSHELIGVVIESQDIVNDQKAIFELAWAGAQVLSKI